MHIDHTNNRVWSIQARSTTSSRRTIRTKSGSSCNSYEKSQWVGRIWRELKNYGSMNFREEDWSKIRTLWMGTHGQNSGITEWSQLFEWLERIIYLRTLQSHSGRSPTDPTLQDNVFIPDNFFEYIYHMGCAISLHSITNSGLIAGGQNSSREWQTVFFTAVNPMNKEHRDPHELDLTKPRLVSYKQKKWNRHQDTVCWVDIKLAQRKGLKFFQIKCNAIIFCDTLPAYCISKVVVMESGRNHIRESFCVISTTDDFFQR